VANVFLGERLREQQDDTYAALGVAVTREFRPTKEYPKGQEVYALTFGDEGDASPEDAPGSVAEEPSGHPRALGRHGRPSLRPRPVQESRNGRDREVRRPDAPELLAGDRERDGRLRSGARRVGRNDRCSGPVPGWIEHHASLATRFPERVRDG